MTPEQDQYKTNTVMRVSNFRLDFGVF